MFVIIIESSFHPSSSIFHLFFSSFIFICWRLYVRHKIVRFVTLFSANYS